MDFIKAINILTAQMMFQSSVFDESVCLQNIVAIHCILIIN